MTRATWLSDIVPLLCVAALLGGCQWLVPVGEGAPHTCRPKTCAERAVTCGQAPDGCGGSLTCGAACACQPKTCSDLGAVCGDASDGCGATLRCGACVGGQVCGGDGTPNRCSQVCTGGWCWEHPLPQGNRIVDLWESPSGWLWTTTGSGPVLRSDGQLWERLLSPNTRDAVVWGTADDDVWLGAEGLWHWDGAAWTAAVVPAATSDTRFLRLAGSSRDDVWALRGDGVVFHFDGHAWLQSYQWPSTQLNDLWVAGPGEVFVVGDFGVVLHLKDGLWSTGLSLPGADMLRTVTGTPGAEPWVGGFTVSAGGAVTSLLKYFDGGGWVAVVAPASATALLVNGHSDVWLADGTLLFHWDGMLWRARANLGASFGGRLLRSGDQLVVGAAGGAVQRLVQGTWRHLAGDEPSSFQGFSGVWGTADDAVWAVGFVAASTFDGKSWARADGVTDGSAVWGSARDDVWVSSWATADTTLKHFDGDAWSSVTTLPGGQVSAGCSLGRTDAWAVGTSAVRLGQSGWQPVPVPGPTTALAALSCLATDSVWAVGNSPSSWDPAQVGRIFKWDGAQLSEVSRVPGVVMMAVLALDDADVWALGREGAHARILHFDGVAWQSLPWEQTAVEANDANATLTALSHFNGHVTIGTNAGFTLEWDGQQLRRARFPVESNSVSAFWTSPTGHTRAVGLGRAVLRR